MILIDDIISLLASLASVGEMSLKEASESGRLDYESLQTIRRAVVTNDADTVSLIVDRLRTKSNQGVEPGNKSGAGGSGAS
jgi:hypothetical protein